MPSNSQPSRALTWILLAAVGLLAFLAWWPVTTLQLFGWDAYPLLASSAAGSPAEVLGFFGRELMDGRYPLGEFHRPLVQASFALDRALSGIEPFGIHRTDLVLHGLGAIGCFLVARRLFGSLAAATVAGAVWALHPVALEVLPAPARRADSLALLFLFLALVIAPRAGGARQLPRAILCAVAAACSAASKESGVLAGPFVWLFVWCEGNELAPRARLKSAWNAAWPALAAIAAFLVLRASVLGGLGGHGQSELFGAVLHVPEVLARVFTTLLPPLDLFETQRGALRFSALALALLVGLALAASSRTSPLGAHSPLLFCILWVSAAALVTGVSGEVRGWYVLLFLPALAWTVGFLVARALELSKSRAGLGAAILAVALAWVGWFARGSLLTGPIPAHLESGSLLIRDFLARLDLQVGSSGRGQRLEIEALIPELPWISASGAPRKLALLSDYSVQAYLDLRFENGRSRVVRFATPEAERPPADDEVMVVLVPPKG